MESQRKVALLLKPREAASALGISEKTLWTFTKKGDIPSIRIGHSVRYSLDVLKDWIKNQTEKVLDT